MVALQPADDHDSHSEQSVTDSSDEYGNATTDSSITSAESVSDEDSDDTTTGKSDHQSKTKNNISPWILRNLIKRTTQTHKPTYRQSQIRITLKSTRTQNKITNPYLTEEQ